MSITVTDLYKAAALNAYIQRGFDMDTAVRLAVEVASKMNEHRNIQSARRAGK